MHNHAFEPPVKLEFSFSHVRDWMYIYETVTFSFSICTAFLEVSFFPEPGGSLGEIEIESPSGRASASVLQLILVGLTPVTAPTAADSTGGQRAQVLVQRPQILCSPFGDWEHGVNIWSKWYSYTWVLCRAEETALDYLVDVL
jgi:hypothetical protein